MPSTSKKQHNFMAAIAHNPAFAKKVGVPQSVGKDFNNADKGKTFKEGGAMKPVDMKKNPGVAKLPTAVRNKMGFMKEGGAAHAEKGEMKKDLAQDKKMVKKAVGMHDKQQHEGKKTNLTKLATGGAMHKMPDGKMMKNSAMKKMARGGGVEIKGKTKGSMIKMNKGGAC
jgi:hypothetical protein